MTTNTMVVNAEKVELYSCKVPFRQHIWFRFCRGRCVGEWGEESASPPGYKTAKLPGLGKVKKLLLMFLAIFQRIR